MMAAVLKPALLPCTPENIPLQLRQANRWAPWAAPWDEEKQKYGKVPRRARSPEHGLSNGSLVGWVSFDEALAAYQARPDILAGVGYLMTGAHGVVGVDLDHCVRDGVVDDWAAEIIAKLDSYTEFSPSGTGLHVMLAGDLSEDWSAKLGEKRDKQPGIDVYGGGARFLTFTGALYPGSPRELRPAGAALAQLEKRYRKSRKVADVHVMPPPSTYELEFPDFHLLDLPARVVDFLEDGPQPGDDRSNLLIRTAASLASAGLTAEQAFALMWANEHVQEVCLNKRGYDDTKAQQYLWQHQARRGAEIVAADRVLTLSAFDVMEDEQDVSDLLGGATPRAANIADEFDVLTEGDDEAGTVGRNLASVGLQRFQFEKLGAFLARPAPKWIIKGLLPQAALAVVFGPSGSGKTFFALDVAMRVATAAPWREVPIAQPGAVAYIVAEGAGGFVDRAKAYCHQYQIDPDALPLHILADEPNMMQNNDVTDLGKALKAIGPLSAIFVDTYARVMGNGNENEAADVNRVVRNCALLHKLTGAIVVLIHHSGKDSANGARGSSALRAAADVEIEVTRTKAYRAATVTKMKDGPDGEEYRFKLNDVVIDFDEDGDPRTSCVVEHLASAPAAEEPADDPTGKPRSEVQQRILTHLASYLDDEVDREEFIQAVRAITPLGPSGVENKNWRALITKPLDRLIRDGLVNEINGRLSMPKLL
jgi:hypothetical protein